MCIVYALRFCDFRQSIEGKTSRIFNFPNIRGNSDPDLRQITQNSGCRNQGTKGISGTLHLKVTYLAYLLGGGVVLDQFAVLHAEARSHPIDLLVDLSPVVVALLPGN
jgi:hypothetical protein